MGEQSSKRRPLLERIKDRIKDRIRDVVEGWVGALDGWFTPEPEPVRIPIRRF